MATNFFFNNYKSSGEQGLLEDLIIESIQIYGMDMYYLPRTLDNRDALYTESTVQTFKRAFPIEVYIRSVDGFSGDQSFMSKFGLEIRDAVTFAMSKRIFDTGVGREMHLPRPLEGDLIYFPLNKKCFQIKFIENKPFFYQLGFLPMYDIRCELFEYSNERFDTGITEIDSIVNKQSTNIFDYSITTEDDYQLGTEDGDILVLEYYDVQEKDPLDDSLEIQLESAGVLDFTERDPFSSNGLW